MSGKRVYKTTFLDESESDHELDVMQNCIEMFVQEQEQFKKYGGSVYGHKTINRGRLEGHTRLYNDYFAENPVYPENLFRRRFRMSSCLFRKIYAAVEAYDPYFVQSQNAAHTWGFSSLQKVTAAMRMLAYGASADSVDDYVRMAESTAIDTLRAFVKAIVELFEPAYLRSPTVEETARILDFNERRGFPGMLGSIDCMHWKWKNCPKAWSGSYKGHKKEPTFILKAVATHDLWIWHAFFGVPGSLNDINVLQRSHVFDELKQGRAPKVNYSINGHNYDMGYYLADGIYPSWSTFVKGISAPQGNKPKNYDIHHSAARKDIERTFGVLQAQFAIIKNPSRVWDLETMKYIMSACIILHNMIVEDEGGIDNIDYNYDTTGGSSNATNSGNHAPGVEDFLQSQYGIDSRVVHYQLQADLIEHQWMRFGNE